MLQVANWGCGSESVLDAASLAEQYARTKNRDDPDVWGFYLRKDLFEPVINPNNDKVATNLIYHQIIGGILTGEYVCSQVNWIKETKNNFTEYYCCHHHHYYPFESYYLIHFYFFFLFW